MIFILIREQFYEQKIENVRWHLLNALTCTLVPWSSLRIGISQGTLTFKEGGKLGLGCFENEKI